MDIRRNSLLYSLPIVMFVVGIFIGTAVSIWPVSYTHLVRAVLRMNNGADEL